MDVRAQVDKPTSIGRERRFYGVLGKNRLELYLLVGGNLLLVIFVAYMLLA